MRIIYLKNGVKCISTKSCEDFDLDVKKESSSVEVVLKAKADITLVNASDTLPLKVNKNDLYFLNGYQSWTDTKEFRLKDRLRNIKKSPHIIAHMFAMAA